MPPAGVARLARFVLIGGAGVCAVVLLYFLYRYAWTGQREFADRGQMLASYGLPVAVALVLLAATRLGPLRRILVAFLILSTTAAVYLGEATLAVWDYVERDAGETWWPLDWDDATRRRIERVAAEHGVEFDTRRKAEVVQELRGRGVDAVPGPSVSPFLRGEDDGTVRSRISMDGEELVPLGGVSGSTAVQCNEAGEFVLYRADARGLNNPQGTWEFEAVDVGVLGDSYAEGYCVPPEQSFAGLIRDHFPRTLNLGLAGTGPLAQLAMLRERLVPFRPPLVLWFYFEGNDLADLDREARNSVLKRYMDADFRQKRLRDQAAVDQVLREFIDNELTRALAPPTELSLPRRSARRVRDFLALSHLRRTAGLAHRRLASTPPEEPDWDLLQDVLREAKATVEAWGGILHFVYLPDRDRYVRGEDFHRDQVVELVRGVGFPVIDVHQAFVERGDPLGFFPFRRFGHYTVEGHAVVADAVLEAVEEAGRW
jgi:hypothetical protein